MIFAHFCQFHPGSNNTFIKTDVMNRDIHLYMSTIYSFDKKGMSVLLKHAYTVVSAFYMMQRIIYLLTIQNMSHEIYQQVLLCLTFLWSGHQLVLSEFMWGESTGDQWNKGQWCGALIFFICAWTSRWENNWDGDLRCHCTYYDVIVMRQEYIYVISEDNQCDFKVIITAKISIWSYFHWTLLCGTIWMINCYCWFNKNQHWLLKN